MTWVWTNLPMIWGLTVDHVALSAPPIVVGLALSLPIGWLTTRRPAWRGVLLSLGGFLYAVPSLPLFVLMPLVLGTGILDPLNVVVALTVYALALMIRVASDALASVDGDVVTASTAIGYSELVRFWRVELPLAGPALLAGLRVVSVSTVSLVSVGALIGVNTLGFLFLDGFRRGIPEEIVVGIAASVLVAFAFDVALVVLGRLLMPWTAAERSPGRRARVLADATAAPA